MGMPDSDVTLGEVNRAVKRLEAAIQNLSGQMTVALGPIGELRVHVEDALADINEQWSFVRTLEARVNKIEPLQERVSKVDALETRISKIELRAAAVGGGASAIILLVKCLLSGK